MNKRQAIKEIETLIKEQKEIRSIIVTRAWLLKVKSIVQAVFSENSLEYKNVKDFADAYYGDEGYRQKNEVEALGQTLPRLLEIVKIKGVYKDKSVNFFSRLNDQWMTSILVGIITLCLGLGSAWGKYLSDTQNIELRQQNKILNDSIANMKERYKNLIRPTLIPVDSNNKPKPSTDTAGK